MGSNRWPLLAFLGGSFFILFFNLWGRSLENHDYLRYAEVAKEMIQSGDWIVPRFNGEIYLHKPPFLFWLIVLPSKIYGSVTPFLARFPSALFAWIGVLIVYLWGRKMWGGERYGLVSSGVLISSYLYFWQGRIARTDMVFSVLILFSLYFFYLRFYEEAPDLPSPPSSAVKGKKGYLLTSLSFIFIGMAGMTKGPVGVLFPLLIMFLFLLKQKKLNFLIRKEFILGYVMVVFLFGSWIIPLIHRVSWEGVLKVWQESKILTRHEPFYLYGYRIWVDFAPWSIFLPFLFIQLWKKDRNRGETFLIIWFVTLFILLTLFPYRASKYLLPAFSPLALLMGGFWRKWSFIPFTIIFLGAVLAWHGYEYRLTLRNEIRTPGLLLNRELKTYQDQDMIGYRVDVDILGKINFYGDRVIPQKNKAEDLKEKAKGIEEIFIITTESGLQDLIKEGFLVTSAKKIDYGKGGILLIKTRRL